ncbi:2Fe-2S iron-sulfur cluster-binding protein [Pinisolibacter sp.]|uniref:2Fe-2S iron-sulfur cluster-binding protein n=1 Tax=Pinisolibacter sp. TaxID=2172024 RepID=UPI002FDC8C5E
MNDETATSASGRTSPAVTTGASGTPRSDRLTAPRRVTIVVEGCGSATASTEERVLVALERAQGFGQLKGLPRKLPVGCRRGGCGVCRARVLAGDYRVTPMSRAHVTEADEAEGVVLACAIYAQSDLTLRLETPSLGRTKGPSANQVFG